MLFCIHNIFDYLLQLVGRGAKRAAQVAAQAQAQAQAQAAAQAQAQAQAQAAQAAAEQAAIKKEPDEHPLVKRYEDSFCFQYMTTRS